MFETLDTLGGPLGMFDHLMKSSLDEVAGLQALHPHVPVPYWKFLEERGHGWLKDDGFAFMKIEERPLSAIEDVFGDHEILALGAKGDIIIIGNELSGVAFGFDTGDDWKMVEVEADRTVTPLDIDFYHFILGVVVCYPQTPRRYANGTWYDILNQPYDVAPARDGSGGPT